MKVYLFRDESRIKSIVCAEDSETFESAGSVGATIAKWLNDGDLSVCVLSQGATVQWLESRPRAQN